MAKCGFVSRWRRFKAYTIDVLLFWVALCFGVVLFLNNYEEKSPFSILFIVIFPVMFIGLQLNLLFSTSQTLGKVQQNIIIADSETGVRAGFGKVFLRFFVSTMMRCMLPMGLIDALCIFGKKRQCLHDMIAETAVVDEFDGNVLNG